MFMHLNSKDFEKLKSKWKKMISLLFKADEKPLRFLRYFITAKYESGERLREDRIYDWFVENKDICGYTENPLEFVDSLVNSAQAFLYFKNGQDKYGHLNRYLLNISYLSTKQHLTLLLASQHLSIELFTELCQEIENFYLFI